MILRLENPMVLSEHLTEEKSLIKRKVDIEKELFRIINKIKDKDFLEIVSQVFDKKNIYMSLIGNIAIGKNRLIRMLL